MALQVGQHRVGSHVIGVPGVHHAERFALALGGFALQAVMLNVVDNFQQHKRYDRLQHEKRYHLNSYLRNKYIGYSPNQSQRSG